MLISIFLTLFGFACLLFLLGLIKIGLVTWKEENGSYGDALENKSHKLGSIYFCLLISMILFFVCAASSFELDKIYCDNQIDSIFIDGNTSTYNNSFSCHTETYIDENLGILTGVLGAICVLLLIIITFVYVFN